ncbi:hypothetical protein [Mycoavidus sp. B2-EB]|uniref:hypothetical protein n=1 Tax=Mycoavidus sp. B2-EB TaxID=2651972 RepID=UPI001625D473|nr:hypothetical protein [Mycoavidus sp. B2-EB]BBO59470.1 hypothetical protein MPB2EB_0589 [Mycoavidus sp. B2-EB]
MLVTNHYSFEEIKIMIREGQLKGQEEIVKELQNTKQAREHLRNNGPRILRCTYSGVNICKPKGKSSNVGAKRLMEKMNGGQTEFNTSQKQHPSKLRQEIILDNFEETERRAEVISCTPSQINSIAELELIDDNKKSICNVVENGSIKEIKRFISDLCRRKENGESVENEQILFLEKLREQSDKAGQLDTQYGKVYEIALIFLKGN